MMRQKEKSPLRGSILANDCGTGKTITFTLLQYMAYLECKDKAKALAAWRQDHEDPAPEHMLVDARPMLIVCPAPLVGQHAEELIKIFKGLLDVHIYYGTKDRAPPSRAAHTLSADEWWQQMESRASGTHDPEVETPPPAPKSFSPCQWASNGLPLITPCTERGTCVYHELHDGQYPLDLQIRGRRRS